MAVVALAGGTPRPPDDQTSITRLLQRPDLGLFAVAQGMGASAAAADLTVQVLSASVEATPAKSVATLTRESSQVLLRTAIQDVQVAWTARVKADPSLVGIGATMIVALSISGGVALAHLGDCAALLLRPGVIVRRTLNHTLRRDYLDATGVDPDRPDLDRIIVRAVGMEREPEIQTWEVAPAQTVVLTAGVHDLLSDAEIGALFCEDLPELARRLVKAAASHEFKDDLAALAFRPGR